MTLLHLPPVITLDNMLPLLLSVGLYATQLLQQHCLLPHTSARLLLLLP
jgi:hypothetical protein